MWLIVSEQPTAATFHLSGARLRINPKRGKDVLITAGEVTDFAGVVKLKGFTRDTAIVEGCHIVFDGSLPKGSIVIEPLEAESNG